jgi:hypothetical protein
MKRIVVVSFGISLMLAGHIQAQTAAPTVGSTTTPVTQGTGNPSSPAAVTTTSEPSRTSEAPVAGANSFTESQARGRIEERGFAQVTDLKKDDKGIWRGTAMKDGKSVAVALDYQGNVVAQ